MDSLEREILQLLAEHAQEPMDYVAVYMFLNTVAGGHYEDRYTEEQIRRAISNLLSSGNVEAHDTEGRRVTQTNSGTVPSRLHITPQGRNALLA